jgi:hypothetical protein
VGDVLPGRHRALHRRRLGIGAGAVAGSAAGGVGGGEEGLHGMTERSGQRDEISINVADVVSVTGRADFRLDDVTVSATGVVLSDDQRSFLKRVLEKVLRTLYAAEVVVEVAPDGTIRVIGRLRT